ncbi:hypothetical protein SVIOM342S_01377 [Streptomyces violaceorubidus]
MDAGPVNSATLLEIGPEGASADHSANPTTVQDVFVRIGGAGPGKATTSLVVNSQHTIVDHTWVWRADHGDGVGWETNRADYGVVVNGDDVLMTGLFVEHFNKYDVQWNGERGRTVFFQNEKAYDAPDQAAIQNGSIKGYAAYKVGDDVTEHEGWGLGSYCYYNVNPSIVQHHGFAAPNRSECASTAARGVARRQWTVRVRHQRYGLAHVGDGHRAVEGGAVPLPGRCPRPGGTGAPTSPTARPSRPHRARRVPGGPGGEGAAALGVAAQPGRVTEQLGQRDGGRDHRRAAPRAGAGDPAAACGEVTDRPPSSSSAR